VSRPPLLRRATNNLLTLVAVLVALGLNASALGMFAYTKYDEIRREMPAYKAERGHWQTVELPEEYRVRAIHAALLFTGEVLLVAGSGNSQEAFDAGRFETVLWNPTTNATTKIDTPEDLFCGGHAYLPNGDLLIAGGTSKYEVLADKVTRAAGPLWMKNESPEPFQVREGDLFARSNGQTYAATEAVTIPAGGPDPATGEWAAGQANVWVEAVEDGETYAMGEDAERLDLTRLDPQAQQNLYAWSNAVTLDKQNYRGLDASYVYSVPERRYVETDDLTFARWYPTLVSLNGGDILAVSGLDEHGVILEKQNEIFDIATRQWEYTGQVNRFFPTYPSLFRLADGRLFYSGSNTGYGVATEGRQPGIWDVSTNTWQDVEGMRDPQMNETSSSFLLAPAQDQRVAILGGGEVGEGAGATGRMDIVDLDASTTPRYEPELTYPSPGRYISAVTLPDDRTLLTGGSKDYRGRGLSDLHLTRMFDPASGELIEVASNRVGRNYHSTAVLLPDGRVMTMGSDPLFADKHNHVPGTFETRIEIFSPPYLFTGTPRPEVLDAPQQVQRGSTFTVEATSAATVTKARLLRPSAVTHLTDPEQRSVALDIVSAQDGTLELSLDPREGLTPSGWYMLFLVDSHGVPSEGRWVQVR
jgi:hypothetical protein